MSGSVLANREDKQVVNSLMINLKYIVEEENPYNEDLIRHLVNAIIVITARNISIVRPQSMLSSPDNRILEIIGYIQIHICQPDLLMKAISMNFFKDTRG